MELFGSETDYLQTRKRMSIEKLCAMGKYLAKVEDGHSAMAMTNRKIWPMWGEDMAQSTVQR